MFSNLGMPSALLPIAFAVAFTAAAPGAVCAQTRPRSEVSIPIRKEQKPEVRVDTVTVHDTVTVVRVDTVRLVETAVRVDTLIRADTLRDSTCSRGVIPIPIPIPLPRGHGGVTAATMVTPEPETLVLVGTGLIGLVAAHFRRRK